MKRFANGATKRAAEGPTKRGLDGLGKDGLTVVAKGAVVCLEIEGRLPYSLPFAFFSIIGYRTY